MPNTHRWQYQGRVDPIQFTTPDFGWFLQQPDVTRPPHQTQPGFFSLVEFEIPAPAVPDFGWFVPPADVVRPPHPRQPGLFAAPVETQENILPDPGWDIQEPDVTRPPHQVRPGFFAAPVETQENILPDFGWFLQKPDVTRPPHQTQPGLFALVELVAEEEPAPVSTAQQGPIFETNVIRMPDRMVGY